MGGKLPKMLRYQYLNISSATFANQETFGHFFGSLLCPLSCLLQGVQAEQWHHCGVHGEPLLLLLPVSLRPGREPLRDLPQTGPHSRPEECGLLSESSSRESQMRDLPLACTNVASAGLRAAGVCVSHCLFSFPFFGGFSPLVRGHSSESLEKWTTLEAR